MATITIAGSVLKMAVNFSYSGDRTLTLDDIDFTCEFFCSRHAKAVVRKADMVREAEGQTVTWSAYVDTALTGPGALRMRIIAEIPDNNSPDGVRTEMAEADCGVTLA